jgi:hypothetical protein
VQLHPVLLGTVGVRHLQPPRGPGWLSRTNLLRNYT